MTSSTGGPLELTHNGTAGAVTAQVSAPAEKTTVLKARPGAESAIAVSSALFRSAPVVAVAAEADRTASTGAGAVAERLGVPVLQVPAGNEQAVAAVRDEVKRLSPQVVLTVGADARREVDAWSDKPEVVGIDAPQDGATITDLPAGLPSVERPQPVDVTVLADTGRDNAAAVATARAAGARVVELRGADPRSDQAAIDALRAEPSAALLALGEDFGPPDRLRKRVDTAVRGGRQLPGGGQVLFPGRMLVCLYGHPAGPALGALGEQDLEATIARAKKLAAEYDPLSDVPVVPSLEIIVTVAQGSPGPDGDYSSEADVESLRPWVDRAGQEGLYVILDLQPGRARLLDQAKRYAPLLEMPHVGLAVDPEWKLGPNQVPLQQIGGVDASEVNEVSAWLADLTAAKSLPQKLLVVHQFQLTMIRDEKSLDTTRDEVQLLIHMDGQGTTGQKVSTWESVVGARPSDLPMGWKNFYDEDKPMLTPQQTMAYEPKPSMVSYQ